MNTIKLSFVIDGDDFTRAGEASASVKKHLKQLGVDPVIIRRVAIALYEGEINMVIHANGGTIDIEVDSQKIKMTLTDTGKGIKDIKQAMQEGFSTAPDEVRSLGFGAGMGLPNMFKNSDAFNINSVVDVGTTVEMTVNINSAS